ncbi:SpoIIE family protein phosphatase [Planctomycetota bacterium]|nr:SpoIIE family protein phosphatase [Planctomycetota bacterium]
MLQSNSMEGDNAHNHELERARNVQLSMLPDIPTVSGMDITASYRACEALGGDFYDFIYVDPWHLGIVIADVSGHGTAAALLMAAAKKVFQIVGKDSLSPRETILKINENIRPDVPRGMFLTVFYGILDIRKLQLSFVSCGHNPPILRRNGQATDQWNFDNAPPLGVVNSDAMNRALVEKSVQLQPTDVLMLYTDGLSEAFNSDGEMYTEERLVARVARASATTAQSVIDAVSNDIDRFRGNAEQSDDETMLILRVAEHTGKVIPLIEVKKEKTAYPTWNTPLVGRDDEVKVLTKSLRDGEEQVITVTGPVGAGKTRVAVTAAIGAETKFFGGTYFVDLSTAKTHDGIGRLVASELQLGSDSADLNVRIPKTLQSSSGRTLLIVDNCDACYQPLAKCVAAWRLRAPDLTVLATCRRPIGTPHEHIAILKPLQTTSEARPDAAKLRNLAAGVLFENAAKAADPSFKITDDNAGDVAAIVHKLDGLPQAIEMTAARVALLSPRQILDRLDERIELQGETGGNTLQSTLALSYDLLPPSERLALLLLSCFRDGFQMDAASRALQAVGGPPPEQLVRSLMTNSLVHVDKAEALGGERRFHLYESVRLFMQAKLREHPEVREHYETALVNYVHGWWLKQKKTGSSDGERRIAIELPNLLSVIKTCRRPDVRAKAAYMAAPVLRKLGEQDRALEILKKAFDGLPIGCEDWHWLQVVDANLRVVKSPDAVLQQLQHVEGNNLLQLEVAIARSAALRTLGRMDEAMQEIQNANAIPGLHPLQKLLLKEKLSVIQASIGQTEEARLGLEEALKIAIEHKDDGARARVLHHLGWANMRSGRHEEALKYLREGLQYASKSSDRAQESSVLGALGLSLHFSGQSQDAEACMLQAIRIARDLGITSNEAAHLNTLGRIYHEMGRDREALNVCTQSRDISREVGARSSEAVAEGNIASLRMELGELDGVLESLQSAYAVLIELGEHRAAFANVANVGRYYAMMYEHSGSKRDLNIAIDKHYEACEGRRGQGFDPMAEAELQLAELLLTANRRKDARPILERLITHTENAKDDLNKKIHEDATEILSNFNSWQSAPRRQGRGKPKRRLPGTEAPPSRTPTPGSGHYPPAKKRSGGSGMYPPVKKQGSGFYPPQKKQGSGFYPPQKKHNSSGFYPPMKDRSEDSAMLTPPPPTRRKINQKTSGSQKRAPLNTPPPATRPRVTNPPKPASSSGRKTGIPPKGPSKTVNAPPQKNKPGTLPKPRPRKP